MKNEALCDSEWGYVQEGDIGGAPGGGTGNKYAATYIQFDTASNQTTLAGTARMYIGNTGNVGIGTTGPTRKLVVYDTDANVSTISLKTDGSGLTTTDGLDLQFGNSNAYLFNKENGLLQFGANNTATITISAGNNVGIGTTNPNATLNVRGGVNVTGSVNLATLEGKVGIGTIEPTSKLQVEGIILGNDTYGFAIGGLANVRRIQWESGDSFFRFYGNSGSFVKVGASGLSIGANYGGSNPPTNGAIFEGNVGIGTASPNATLQIMGAANVLALNVNNTLYVNTSSSRVGIGTASPNSTLHVDVWGSNTLAKHLIISDIATPPTDWRIYGGASTSALQIQSRSTKGLLLVPTTTGNANLIVGDNGLDIYTKANVATGTIGTLAMTITDNQTVGIGTTSPGTNIVGTYDYASTARILQVDGTDARLIVRGSASAGLDLIDTGAATNNWTQLINDGGITYFRTATDTGAIQADNILVFNNTNGNIGIGTTNPNVKLEIASGAIRLSDTYEIGWGTSSSLNMIYGSSASKSLGFRTDGFDRMVIDTSGNVGINTTSPGLLLTLNGTAGLPAASGSVQTGMFRIANTAGLAVMDFGTNGNGWIQTTISNSLGADTQHLLLNPIGGNVGINCAAPDSDLEIGGTGAGCNTGTGSYINAGSTAFSANSQRAIKTNIVPFTRPNMLNAISNVPVYTYDFKPEFCEGDKCKNRLGLIAEDFYTVLQRGDGKSINGQDVDMALWLAVQELDAKVTTLEKENNNLTKENQALKSRLAALEAKVK